MAVRNNMLLLPNIGHRSSTGAMLLETIQPTTQHMNNGPGQRHAIECPKKNGCEDNMLILATVCLVSPLGIEPRTYGLKVRCSTN